MMMEAINGYADLSRQVSRRILPGGDIRLGDEVRKKLCLLEDGELCVAEAYKNDPAVQSFVQRLRYMEVRFSEKLVPAEDIPRLWSEGAVQTSTSTDRQAQAIGIIRRAIGLKASDIHLIRGSHSLKIKFRVHGELEIQTSLETSEGGDLQASIYQSMCTGTENTYKPSRAQDGRLKEEYVTKLGLYGARVATRPTADGQLMMIRLLYDTGEQISLSAMGYLQPQLAELGRLVRSREGVVILTGTTGSGKSTTLQVALKEVIKYFQRRINVMTVEDPPEYRIDGANQTPLLREADLTDSEAWQRSIKNLMRLDPDVMMLGEIRDQGSAQVAFEAALTGHGLWTTLHTKDPISALQRLIELGVSPALVTDPSLVRGVINQTLTRVLCQHCKRPFLNHVRDLPEDLVHRVNRYCEPENVFIARGPADEYCRECSNRGVTGRTLVAEVMVPNLTLMRHFRGAGGVAEARQYWIKELGGITKTQHLIHHINSGVVDPSMGERDVHVLDEEGSA